jgi:hypothetical protein
VTFITDPTVTKAQNSEQENTRSLDSVLVPLGMTVGLAVYAPRTPLLRVHHAEQFPRALYIGMTNDLHRRLFQHKTQEFEGFSDDYNAVRLVYWESSDDVHKTIAREKQLKN